jgi:hypothetical protein
MEALESAETALVACDWVSLRRQLEDLLSEAVVNDWPETLAELEGLCLRARDEAPGPAWRVPFAALASQAALMNGVEPQAGLAGEALLYATRAFAFARALELLRLAARDEATRDDAAFASAVVYKTTQRLGYDFAAFLTPAEPERRRPEDEQLREEVREFTTSWASLRDQARWRRRSLTRAVDTLESGVARMRARRQADEALLEAADAILADPAVGPSDLALLEEMLGRDSL